MSEEKKFQVKRRLDPRNPVKAANKFLYSRLNELVQIDVCNLDLAELHAANQKLQKGEDALLDLPVVDRFLLNPLAVVELHEMTRVIINELRDAGILEIQTASSVPKMEKGSE